MSNANNPPDPERWLHATVSEDDERAGFDRRDFMKAGAAASALGIFGSASVGAQSDEPDAPNWKTRPTVWTTEDRENARANIEAFDWAQSFRDQVVQNSELILEAYDLEDLWRFVPSPTLPRSTNAPNSPAIDGYDHTFGSFDYASHPDYHWKIVVRGNDGRDYRLPTNDFAAYRESGRDDRGFFDPALADDSLLVNEEYPDLPDDWGVDDSTGFVDDEGILGSEGAYYNPVARYNYWRAIYGVRQMVMELGHAYMFTEDRRYARAAAVILDRIADVYPESTLTWNRIFEAFTIRSVLRSYDAVFPGMAGDDELAAFLDGKTDEYPELGRKDSVGWIRRNIEEGLLHQILPYVRNYEIRGNFGMHQAALAISAVVADDPEGYTAEAIDFTFRPGTTLPGEGRVTGGDILGFLVGSPQSGYMVDEEGYPTESSVHYNTLQQSSLEEGLGVLRGYDAYEGADLYQNPKFKGMIDSHWQLTFGQYIPQIANTHGVGNPKAVAGATPKNDRVIQDPDFALTGFDEYGKPELAQWAYMLNGLSTEGLERGIFHPNPEGIRDEVQAVIDERGPYPIAESNQQPAYGFTALRDGEYGWGVDGETSARGVYQYYGRNAFGVGSGHTHADTLNLGVYGYDLDLSPELGREGNDWEGNDLDPWVDSTPAHNTVTVDGEDVHPQWVGYPKHFDHTERVQLMDVEAPRVYPQTDEYRRTTAMVAAGEDASYVVDFFRVDGGDDHHFSFHAAPSHDVATDGLVLEAQDGGTYEGADVAFGEGGSFSYLYDVERDDDPEAGFAVDWDVADYWEVREDDGGPVGLRLTMLNEVDDVALATGRPAEQASENNPEELPFLLAHRGEGSDDGESVSYDFVDLEYEASTDVTEFGTPAHQLEAQAAGAWIEYDLEVPEAGQYELRMNLGTAPSYGIYEVSVGGESIGTYDCYDPDGTVSLPIETTLELHGGPTTIRFEAVGKNDASSGYKAAFYDLELNAASEPDGDEEVLETTFTSVIEPYEGSAPVAAAELVPVTSEDEDADLEAVRAVKVELEDGRVDYVVSSTDRESKFEIDGRLEFKGAFAVYAERNGEREFAYTNDALLLTPDGKGSDTPLDRRSVPRYRGEVEDFTKELTLENEMEVKITDNPKGNSLSQLVGEYIYVDPAEPDPIPDGVTEDERYDNEARDKRNGVFKIEGVERTDTDRAVIDVGEHTFIRRYYTNDPGDGYSYSIEEGAEFVVPLGKLSE